MSKKMLGFLIGIILFGIMMAGATFAFFTAEFRIGNKHLAGANRFNVVIDNDSVVAIDGPITLGISKEEGLSGHIKFAMDPVSILSKANLYFNITDISNNVLTDGRTSWKKALIWELYKNDNNNLVLVDTGNFLECSETGQKTCVNGDKLYMLKNFDLTYEFQSYDVYIWLDGNIADNGVEGAYIKANISLETEEFSADLD